MTADVTGVKLSDTAKQLLDRYLRELRMSLTGCPSVDPAEVEADVKQHIDQELADAAQPISGEQLGAVLNKLGSPTQWVPLDELPWWRRIMVKLRMAPTSERWALGIFAVLVLGFLLLPADGAGLALIGASFILARALIAMTDQAGEQLAWRRWLVYPSLLVVYIPMMLFLLFGACAAAGVPYLVADGWRREMQPEMVHQLRSPVMSLFAGAAGLGLWWMIVAIVLLVFPRLPGVVFHPFIPQIRRRSALGMFAIGLLIAVAGAPGAMWWMRT